MKNFKIFIGSNNETKKLEKRKIIKKFSANFDGFTVYEAVGFWKASQEKTAIVEVSTEQPERVIEVIQELKIELKQEAIAFQEIPTLNFI